MQQPRMNAGGLCCIGHRKVVIWSLDMAWVLVEHGADATAQDKPGQMRVDSAACGILKWSPGPGMVPRRARRRCSSPGQRREDSTA